MHTRHRFWQISAMVALITGLLGIIQLYRGEVHWKNEVPLDGLIALFAALIAFIAIMIQLEEDRSARTEEAERRKRSVASALSAEIDDFYKFFLEDFWRQRSKIWPSAPVILMEPPLPELGPLPSTTLLVYRSTADQLGTLSVETMKSVVGLYNFIAGFVEHYETYRSAWRPSSTFGDNDLATKLRDVCELVPRLILDSDAVCERLANEQGTSYDVSRFWLARVRKADDKGKNMKQALEEEDVTIRDRMSKRKVI